MARPGRSNNMRFNGLIFAQGYGVRAIPARTLDYGISVIARGAYSRVHQTAYTDRVTSSSFSLGLIFSNVEEYRETANWFLLYGAMLSDPNRGSMGPMRVIVPSHDFDKTGIPRVGMAIGDKVDQVTYSMSIDFEGARDSVVTNESQSSFWSQFFLPSQNDNAPMFYPGDGQLSGDEGLYAPVFSPITELPRLRGPW